ncbi:MAG: hypothetical protein P8J32_05240 [bacterium]|nr:hypothetical protein [bacterium]
MDNLYYNYTGSQLDGTEDPNTQTEDPQTQSGGEKSHYDPQVALNAAKAGGIATAVGGITDIVMGIGGIRRGKEALSTAEQDLKNLMASQPSLSTPAEYYKAVKNAYDQSLLQMRTNDINRSLATTTQAAQQYGSRGLGAVMQAQQQGQQQMSAEALNQQQLQTQALTNLAQARERETGLREGRSTRDIEYGYDAKALAEAQLAQSRQQVGQGVTGLVGGSAKALMGFGVLEEGGKVSKTPGEFNHDTNEMEIVDEAGNSVGITVTGGEYVIAPDDAKELRELAGGGKTALHKFVKSLVRRFEKADDNG